MGVGFENTLAQHFVQELSTRAALIMAVTVCYFDERSEGPREYLDGLILGGDAGEMEEGRKADFLKDGADARGVEDRRRTLADEEGQDLETPEPDLVGLVFG